MKVAIYIRVSTQKKVKGRVLDEYLQNPEVQLIPLKKLAEAREWEIFKIYSDRMSGAKKDRPAYLELWKDARAGEFEVVLVWRFDRFARSTSELLQSLEELRVRGISFVSSREQVDTSTPIGKTMFTLIAAIAELERDLTRERVIAGMEYAREKGTKSGKTIGRQKVVIDKFKVDEMRKGGMSVREIARALGVSKSVVGRI